MRNLARLALVALALAALPFATYGADGTTGGDGKATPALQASAPPATAANSLVKVIYFIPQNRSPQTCGVQNLKNYIKICQQFFSNEMARDGIYKPGTTQGKTFEYEKDASGEPIIHIVNGVYDDSYYAASIFDRVLNEVVPTYSPTNTVVLIMTECQIMSPDGSFIGGAMGGSYNGLLGNSGGYAVIGGDTLWLLDQSKWSDNTEYDGLQLPQFPYPLRYSISYPGFHGPTIGQNSSAICGAVTHELGHALGLPHCFVNDYTLVKGDLMGNGLRGFRGDFGNFPDEQVWLFKGEAELISQNRFFNPGDPYTDSTPPVQTTDVKLEDPLGSINIHVKGMASDSGSGLWRCNTAILPPGSTVSSEVYDDDGSFDFRITSDEVPLNSLYPGSYTLFIKPIDNMGNKIEQQIWVPVPYQLEQQYYADDGTWATVPTGSEAPNGNLRMVMSLSYPTNEQVTLTPEVEIRPVGTPFSNTANFTGAGVTHTGYEGSAYVQVQLAPGQYHWQYRIKSSNSSQTPSCWVTFGTNNTYEADIKAIGKPSFTTQPTDITKCLGQKVTLTALATGAPTITYKWRKNGVDIAGATSASYTINTASATDTGMYTCVATNTYGSTNSAQAFVTIREGTAPVVTTQPQNQSACWTWGTNIAAHKTATASHCWTTDSVAGAVDGSIGANPRWTTYNTGDQEIESYDVDFGGTYTISAINSYIYDDGEGVKTPQSFELQYKDTNGNWLYLGTNGAPEGSKDGSKSNTMVFAPVQATGARIVMTKRAGHPWYEGLGLTEFQVYSGAAGQIITFTTEASGATPFGYQWRKNGVPITGATGSSYVIPIVIPSYSGNYDCTITNDCGQVTTNVAKLTINDGTPPLITTQPTSQIKDVGESVTFSIAATGTSLTYQWRKNGVSIPGAVTTSYVIPSISMTDVGSYDCVVTKNCGAVTSSSALLVVGPSTQAGILKTLSDGSPVILKSGITTLAFPYSVYVEDSKRAYAIRVDKAGHGLSSGALVDVAGTIKTDGDQERYIDANVISPVGTGKVKPLYLGNKELGGADQKSSGICQKGVKDGVGLNNIGMLVTVFGKITVIDYYGSYFYIDDGSHTKDGTMTYSRYGSTENVGVRVCSSGWRWGYGRYVKVTGISTLKLTSSGLIRQIKVLNDTDIQMIQ